MDGLEIRRLRASDLDAVTRAFSSEYARTHADDLADQAAGRLSFHVAWLDGAPVGHGLVRWAGPRSPEVSAVHSDCPELYRLGVLPGFRSNGIGTRIVLACEADAADRGHPRIGLGVGHENPRARKLYRRLGYDASEPAEYTDAYRFELDTGEVVWVRDLVSWWIKSLA